MIRDVGRAAGVPFTWPLEVFHSAKLKFLSKRLALPVRSLWAAEC